MCTATWWQTASETSLFFNRDEQRSRQVATPPTLHKNSKGQPLWIGPLDQPVGGTWIFANTSGIIAALLNYDAVSGLPERTVPKEGWISRGLILQNLTAATTLATLEVKLRSQPLPRVRAFQILAFHLTAPPFLFTWDGLNLTTSPTHSPPSQPITSSSFRSAEVVAQRKALFAKLFPASQPTPQQLLQFHLSHDPSRPAHSINMRRTDAASLSLTKVELKHKQVTISYFTLPDPPQNPLPPPIHLSLPLT